MSGIPQFNFPAFDDAARLLRKRGLKMVSPAELDSKKTRASALRSKNGDPQKSDRTWGDFLARDVKIVADEVDGIIFLPGWSSSRGARLEAYVGILCKHEFHLYLGDGRMERLPAHAVMGVLYAQADLFYEVAA